MGRNIPHHGTMSQETEKTELLDRHLVKAWLDAKRESPGDVTTTTLDAVESLLTGGYPLSKNNLESVLKGPATDDCWKLIKAIGWGARRKTDELLKNVLNSLNTYEYREYPEHQGRAMARMLAEIAVTVCYRLDLNAKFDDILSFLRESDASEINACTEKLERSIPRGTSPREKRIFTSKEWREKGKYGEPSERPRYLHGMLGQPYVLSLNEEVLPPLQVDPSELAAAAALRENEEFQRGLKEEFLQIYRRELMIDHPHNQVLSGVLISLQRIRQMAKMPWAPREILAERLKAPLIKGLKKAFWADYKDEKKETNW